MRASPGIFIAELRLLRHWKPGTESEIRHVTFRRGLNILWADPCNDATENTANRVHGHAAGKTTFCRILRHLLGEKHFGTKDVEQRIRQQFPDGWAVMRVELAGESWVVARAFGGGDVAVRDTDIDAVLSMPIAQLPGFSEYEAALSALALTGLKRRELPGKTTRVEWLHLLPWLARDQESAFIKLCEWRNAVSEADPKATSDDDRQFLVRLFLDLISPEESDSQDKQTALNATKREHTDRLARKLQGIEYLKDKVRPDLPEGVATGDELGVLLFGQWKQAFENTAPRTQLGLHLPLVERARVAEDALRTLDNAIAGHKGELIALEKTTRELQSFADGWDAKVRKAKTAALNEQLGVPAGVCGRKREEAKGHCPLYTEAPLSFGKAVWENLLDAEWAEHTNKLSTHQTEVSRITELLQRAEANRPPLLDAHLQARDALQRAVVEDEMRMEQWRQKLARLSDLVEEKTNADWLEEEIKRVESDIKAMQDLQKDLRRAVERNRSAFSDRYAHIVRRIYGDEVKGAVSFFGRELRVEVSDKNNMRSGGVNALKHICFDIAAMLHSAEGRSHLPAFLIHDSPRAADLSSLLYGQIFKCIGESEVATPAGIEPAFQYIITTTEPPPAGFTQKPYLLTDQPLRASIPAERLFKCDL